MSDAMTPTPAELARSFMSEFVNVDRVSFNFTNALGCYDTSNYSGDTARAALDAMLAKARKDALREAIQHIRNDAWPEDGTYGPEDAAIQNAERATVDVCVEAIQALIPTAEGEA